MSTQLRINADIIRKRVIPSQFNSPFNTDYTLGQFNNWIIPGFIACGPFPGKDGMNYMTDDDVKTNLKEIRDTGIDTFVSLQSEISPQDGSKGVVQKDFNWAFPNFCNYSYYMYGDDKVKYLHMPLKDMFAPDCDEFRFNVNILLEEMLRGRKLFIHCAGGHGRTGMYAAVLISLLEGCSPQKALEHTQYRHNARRVLDRRQKHQVLSPSTYNQRNLVLNALKQEIFTMPIINTNKRPLVDINKVRMALGAGAESRIIHLTDEELETFI